MGDTPCEGPFVNALGAPIERPGNAMSRLIQPALRAPKGLNDARSTGAAPPIRAPNVQAPRGTLKRRLSGA